MLDKAIASGKEKRAPYRKSKRFDRTCRNHGACPYCAGNRKHKRKAGEHNAREQVKEFEAD